MPDCKVFYSWQSDLPNATNRGLIQTALETAVKSIRNDDSIEVEPVVDRDTSGIPGSPDIASTIFAKIEEAYVFLCDVSIINSETQSRPTPNPNVLIELGYAIKTLGSARIIMVMNTVFGTPEQLPFDLRMRRVITYKVPKATTEKASERNQLAKTLQVALKTIFTEQSLSTVSEVNQPLSIGEQAILAVENDQPNQEIITRKFMSNLVNQLDAIAPDFRKPVSDQMIVDSLAQTIELGVEFSRLAEAIALIDSSKAAMAMYKGFEEIIGRYHTPIGFSGSSWRLAFDFYRFIGHEFFVILFSFLIREGRWRIITEILDEELYIDNLHSNSKPATVPFVYICSHLESLEYRNRSLNLNRLSIHADLLNERHTQGSLAKVAPMEEFINADCFLFLRAEFQQLSKINSFYSWVAWSSIYIEKPPRYLVEAYRIKNAQKLLAPLKIDNVLTLRNRMIEVIPKFREAFRNPPFGLSPFPIGDFDPEAIASRE